MNAVLGSRKCCCALCMSSFVGPTQVTFDVGNSSLDRLDLRYTCTDLQSPVKCLDHR